MFDFRERKDLLVILIIGILLVLAFMIFAFIMIWKPKEKPEFVVGEQVNQNTFYNELTDDYKAYQYVKRISTYFKNKDYKKIYSYLAKDYINYYNMNESKLENKIKSLNIDGEEIYLEKYSSTKLGDFLNIYMLTVRGKDNDYSASITLREKSPRQFELAFDDFVLYDNSLYEKSAENVSLNIVSKLYTSTNVTYDLKITNKNSFPIELNSNRDNKYIYLRVGDTSYYSDSMANTTSNVSIGANQIHTMRIKFSTVNLNLNNISAIVLGNVKFSNDKKMSISYDLK